MKACFTLRSVVGLFGLIALTNCGGETGPDVTPARITLSPTSKTLPAGQTVQLSATVANAAGTPLPAVGVTYQSSTAGIATVTSGGLVTAALVGTANITASLLGLTSPPVAITVVAGAAATLTKATDLPAAPVAGSTTSISAKLTDNLGNPVAGVSVTFVVAAGAGVPTPITAPTDASGIATTSFKVADVVGVNTVTATPIGVPVSPVSFSATSVAAAAATVTKISTDPASVIAGGEFGTEVRVRVKDSFGNAKSGAAVTFAVTAGGGTVTAASVVTNAAGDASSNFITGRGVGANTATAAVSGLPAVSFSITTVPGPISSVVAGGAKVLVVPIASTVTPAIVARDINGNVVSPTFTYTSRTPSVATISASGAVTGIVAGQTLIVATSGNLSDSLLAVVTPVGGVVLMSDLGSFTLEAGATVVTTILIDMGTSNEKLGSTSVRLDWDPAVLLYQSNAVTGTGPAPTVNAAGAATGSLLFSLADAGGFTGKVQLLKVTFVAGAALKTGALALSTSEVAAASTFTNLLPKTVAVTMPFIIR